LIYIADDLKAFRPEIEYSINDLIKNLGVEQNKIDFFYADDFSTIHIEKISINIKPARKIFSQSYKKVESLPSGVNEIKFGNETIPVLYSTNKPKIEVTKNIFVTNVDFVETFFFFLTRYEEQVITKRDKLDRFPDDESLIIKYGLNLTPVLDVYSKVIRDWLKESMSLEDKMGYFLLTHDIDRLNTRVSLRHGIKKMIINHDTEPIKFYFKDRKDGISYGLSDILKYESEFKVNSVFFFMVKKGNLFVPNSDYSIKDKKIRQKINEIKDSDSIIGLHPSLKTLKNKKLLETEKSILESIIGRKIEWSRKHYLRYSINFTFKDLEESGFKYDSSIGYINHVGYKSGTSHPFLIFDMLERKSIDLIEIPLIIMDQALIRSSLGKVEKADQILNKLINNTINYGGILTILWHNHMVMNNSINKELDRYYLKILNTLQSNKIENYLRVNNN